VPAEAILIHQSCRNMVREARGGLPAPVRQICRNSTLPGSQQAGVSFINNHHRIHHNTRRDATQHTPSVMKRLSINASQFLEKKSKARLVEWQPLKRSRANKFVAVEVDASTKASRSRRKARQSTSGIKKNDTVLDASPMDNDETLWMGEPVASGKKRVSLPSRPSLLYLTYISDRAHLHRGIYSKDRPLLEMSSRF
jgi:hypothetical protein